jgi:putative tryptophan/tyrosine transport system substrate-binding protein
MRRREFITLLGSAAAWPHRARAQQAAIPVVGYLGVGTPETWANVVAAFRKGLSETGYVEGRNVAIEFRFARNEFERLPEFAADLVRRQPVVIATPSSAAATLAAKAATTTIPIVFSTGADPVQTGLVASLNRPGGNVTGVNNMSGELGAKQLGPLYELLPGATRFAVLVNPNNRLLAEPFTAIQDAQATASTLGLQAEILYAGTNRDIDTAFASLVQKRANALLVGPDPLFNSRLVQLATLAVYHRVPAIYFDRAFAEVGGMLSYGANVTDQHRQLGIYTGRILKGEKPADMPVLRAIKFEFVINLQTARTLAIDVPPSLLSIADEVIE